MKKFFEREEYETNGIKVLVEIDYKNEKISLVEDIGKGNYVPKRWVFASREVEYMDGWRNILKAMEHAFTEAEKKLEKHLDKEDRERARLLKAMES